MLRSSDDFGKSWTAPDRQNIRFPEGSGLSLVQIWQIQPAGSDDPNTIYAGVEPSALFVSRDAGDTWEPVDGILKHEHRPRWQPGGGGLCLHTIVPSLGKPKQMLVAMSTGGVYRSDDGGRSWKPRNGNRAQFLPDNIRNSASAHKVVSHPSLPIGCSRRTIGACTAATPRGATSRTGASTSASRCRCIRTIPRRCSSFRSSPTDFDARRRRNFALSDDNAGKSWKPLTKGLPQQMPLRRSSRRLTADNIEAACTSAREAASFGSANGGDKAGMPTVPAIVCVKAATVGSS
jgi:hypothetical protein